MFHSNNNLCDVNNPRVFLCLSQYLFCDNKLINSPVFMAAIWEVSPYNYWDFPCSEERSKIFVLFRQQGICELNVTTLYKCTTTWPYQGFLQQTMLLWLVSFKTWKLKPYRISKTLRWHWVVPFNILRSAHFNDSHCVTYDIEG